MRSQTFFSPETEEKPTISRREKVAVFDRIVHVNKGNYFFCMKDKNER